MPVSKQFKMTSPPAPARFRSVGCPWRRPGQASHTMAFTLVEVIASLALVGTLFVAVLLAHNRAARQVRLAQRRIEAVRLLDQLVAKRLGPDPGELQLPRGKMPGANPYRWRSELRHDPDVEPLGAAVLRIELFDPAFSDGQTVASVELLEPSGQSLPPLNK